MGRGEVDTKLDLVRANLEKLERIPQSTHEEFLADFRNLDSALHRLQTTIQALMDIGSHLCARLGLPASSSSRDVLQALEDAQRLPQGSADRFGPIFAFHNRVVHLYDRIDPRIVFRLLTEERKDLRDLLDLLLGILEEEPPPTP
jgi:uncharacterized protein YutE (UPF0331/DUF86 family)